MILMNRISRVFAVCLVALAASTASADVKLANIFGDHMVLQRNAEVSIWGTADAGESVTVTLGDAKKTAKADANGHWRVELPEMKAGGPHTMTVVGSNTVTVKDILIGEVWLCSGQSNMEWRVKQCSNAKQEIASANHPKIRHFKVGRAPSGVEIDNVPGKWAVCSPKTVADFTAAGYYMARKLQAELGVPVGLIGSNWGGTRIEPWTPPAGFDGVPELAKIAADVKAKAKTAKPGAKVSHQAPTMLYNGMIHGLEGYAMRGAVWYQGESNRGDGMMYHHKKRALVEGWRKVWGIGEFPFYFVQIAPFQYGKDDPHQLARLWEAQATSAREIPNTGMVVINDIATLNNIHPPNKQDVGLRLANMALKRTYGKSGIVDTGPVFKSLATEANQLRVVFDSADGLKTRDGKAPTHFEIAGKDGKFAPATAMIEGKSVVLKADGVTSPVAVRFAWHKLAEPNLVNAAGLPTGAFRAGEMPKK